MWVSDHLVQPAAQDYPSPYLFDPLVTLTWAAAVTERVELGTSVLVVPQHHPLELANTLASLDALSGGRLIVGVGVGWSAGEFDALGQSFHDRGARSTRSCGSGGRCGRTTRPASTASTASFDDLRRAAQAGAPDPGLGRRLGADRRAARAVEHGDGFHFISVTPERSGHRIAAAARRRVPSRSS